MNPDIVSKISENVKLGGKESEEIIQIDLDLEQVCQKEKTEIPYLNGKNTEI